MYNIYIYVYIHIFIYTYVCIYVYVLNYHRVKRELFLHVKWTPNLPWKETYLHMKRDRTQRATYCR